MSKSATLDAAIKYASRGWRVVPVQPVRQARRPIWTDLSPGERALIQKTGDAYPKDFDRLLIGYFARGLLSGEAEVRVVLDLLDRELGLDRPGGEGL